MRKSSDDKNIAVERIAYYDILRGAAIIGVIVLHSLDALKVRDFVSYTIFHNIFNASVPLFLAVSGFFVARYKFDSVKSYGDFIKKRLARVYVPYLFWSIALSLLAIIVNGKSPLLCLVHILLFKVQGPYYFILLVIQCFAVTPLLGRMDSRNGLVLFGALSFLSCMLVFAYRSLTMSNPELLIYGASITTCGIFYVLGYYYGLGYKVPISNPRLLCGVIIVQILSWLETAIYIKNGFGIYIASSAVRISTFAYAYLLIVFLLNNVSAVRMGLLAYIGKVSFGVYLIHLAILLFVVRTFAEKLDLITVMYIPTVFLLVLLVMSISLCTITLVRMLAGKRILRVIGFE